MKHTTIVKIFSILGLSFHFLLLNASDNSARITNESILPNTPQLTKEERLKLDQIAVMKRYFTPTEQSGLELDQLSSSDIEQIREHYDICGRCRLSSLLKTPDYHYDDNVIYYVRILDILLSKNSNLSSELAAHADDICYFFTEPVTILFPLSTFIQAFVNKLATPKDFESAVKDVIKINSIEELEQFLKKELDNSDIQHPCEKGTTYKFISQYFKRAPLSSETVFKRFPASKTKVDNKTCYEKIMEKTGELLENVLSSLDKISKVTPSFNQKEFIDTVFLAFLSDIEPVEFTIKGEFIKEITKNKFLKKFREDKCRKKARQDKFRKTFGKKLIKNKLRKKAIQDALIKKCIKDEYKFNLKRDFFNARYTNRKDFNNNMRIFWYPAESIHDNEIFSLAEAVQRFYYVIKVI